MTTTQSSTSPSTAEVGLVARIRAADPAEQAFMALARLATKYDPRPLLRVTRGE